MARRRILVVEDSQLVTDALSVLFTGSGFDVSIAPTVASAIESATSHDVDVMLLDLTLPDGDGLEVLDALRQRGALPRTTLAMTGHADAEVRERCLRAGCADVLVKPVPIGDLIRRIEHQLA